MGDRFKLSVSSAMRVNGVAITAPLVAAAAVAVLPLGAHAGGVSVDTDSFQSSRQEDVELAQLRMPRLRFPGLPAVPRIFAITPERRALLNTIRYAEGTWKEGADVGYRVMFGGSLMKTLDRHPDRINYTSGYASAAAGAYQFMPATWRLAVRALDLVGFGPHAQDQAALYLIQRRGALPLADRGILSKDLAAKLAPEWASFPTLRNRSYYGQPVVKYGRLKRFYEANLARLRNLHPPMVKTVEPEIIIDEPVLCSGDAFECMLEGVGQGDGI